MDYEDRLIIYIDILGFSKFVEYTSHTKVNSSGKIKKIDDFLSLIREYFGNESNNLLFSKSRQATSFSDLIVISISVDDINNMDFEIGEVYNLLMNSAYRGFLLRGAISYGKIIHTKEVIFGPEFTDIYNKERTIAKYPRVIIDDVVYADLKDIQENAKARSFYNEYISRDSDDLYYIDLLKELRENTDNFWEYAQILNSYCNILLEMMDNPSLQEKYIWLRNKFVTHINKYADVIGHVFSDENITKDDIETLKMMLYEFNDPSYKDKI